MAIGDAAAAAGMPVVDGATTPAKDIDTEINRTRDFLAEGRGSTVGATAGKVVKRDAFGRAQFATPSAPADAATKAYVDAIDTSWASITGKPASFPPAAHTHQTLNATGGRTFGILGDVGGSPGWGTGQNIVTFAHLFLPASTAATSGYTIAYINSDGRVSRGASSQRYKKYISDIDPSGLGDVFPELVRYQMRNGDGAWKYGHIAERLAEHPDQAPFVVHADVDGEQVPDSIDFIALLLVQTAQLHQRVQQLEARLNDQEEA